MAIGWDSDSDVSSDDDHPHPLGLISQHQHGGASAGVGLSAPLNVRKQSTLATGGERAPARGIVNLTSDDAGSKVGVHSPPAIAYHFISYHFI